MNQIQLARSFLVRPNTRILPLLKMPLAILVAWACSVIWVPESRAQSTASIEKPQFTEMEIYQLVTPIAEYPDVLLQTILAASTFPDQIVDAALLVKNESDAALIKRQAWDDSVKVVATYPGILSNMFKEISWTTRLGQAYLTQHHDVLNAIQQIRRAAYSSGELVNNAQQKVTSTKATNGTTIIVIEPTNPEIIYVPQSSSSSSSTSLVPLVSFGLGMAVGAAIANSNDDNYYYYGAPWGWGAPSYWYGDDNYDRWMDYREDRWDDRSDIRRDRMESRQDRADNRQEFRQEQIQNGNWTPPSQEQRDKWKANSATRQENRQSGDLFDNKYNGQKPQQLDQNRATRDAAASKRADMAIKGTSTGTAAGRGSFSSTGQGFSDASVARDPFRDRGTAGSRADSQSRGWSSQSEFARQNNSAFSGYGSRSQVGAYSARGASSRASANYAGGGSRGARSGGGASRGGGGGRGGRR